ncbi:pyridoxamine 5'-phosphate oxidase family protein [Thomasclavelia cocleata]|uniref:pyridoxamine 5'-phosphate oxidase family protein n=1 Tax=Thomasclavelia cocleata TaxID=69824 RepID=UPI00242BBB8A|nr:pyridoxamine 5'-phosphate oxidase family protein [Thomasclavelia cocleata]
MDCILNKDDLLYVFKKEQCIDLKEEALVIVKDSCEELNLKNCLVKRYSDDFESLLKIKIPSKIRKPRKLLSYQQCYDVMKRIDYGVLSISYDDFPYAVGINHIIIDGRIFFHCAKVGFKLNGVNKKANFLVTEDLGINLDVGTHNHRSVSVFGTLKEVTDNEIKREALLTLIHDLAPKHPFHDKMVINTNILELDIDYIIGKAHIY